MINGAQEMIICINCNSETKSKMDVLLSKNHYRDYSELVAVAVDNLWMLELEVAEKGAFIIGEGPATPASTPPATLAENNKPLKKTKGPVSAPTRQGIAAKAPSVYAKAAPLVIPDLFLADGLDSLSINAAEIPPTENAEKTFMLDRWLFGQYNKLLPAKVNCRALLRFAAEHPDGALLGEITPQIGKAATMLGDYLAEHDRRHQIGRDNSLATAFPRSGSEAEKSRARYVNQFVGSVNSQGILSGLLWDYRLAALAPGDNVRLMPTKPAVQFARLSNPVLDTCQTDPAQKFSPEEATFLLGHIRDHVPVEIFTFRTLIQAITDGADTPDKLEEALRSLVPTESSRSLSPSFLTSQRSSALSRMADLGLIGRQRKGVRVSYVITERGRYFIESK
jgi:hypothetical protein